MNAKEVCLMILIGLILITAGLSMCGNKKKGDK